MYTWVVPSQGTVAAHLPVPLPHLPLALVCNVTPCHVELTSLEHVWSLCAQCVVLSDRADTQSMDPKRPPLPALLAVGAVHHHLIRQGVFLEQRTGQSGSRHVLHGRGVMYGPSAVHWVRVVAL